MEGRFGKQEPVETILGQPTSSHLLLKSEGKGSRYQVQLKLGTRHIKDSLHTVREERVEIIGCSAQPEVKSKGLDLKCPRMSHK
jgi:hypothetical protein